MNERPSNRWARSYRERDIEKEREGEEPKSGKHSMHFSQKSRRNMCAGCLLIYAWWCFKRKIASVLLWLCIMAIIYRFRRYFVICIPILLNQRNKKNDWNKCTSTQSQHTNEHFHISKLKISHHRILVLILKNVNRFYIYMYRSLYLYLNFSSCAQTYTSLPYGAQINQAS